MQRTIGVNEQGLRVGQDHQRAKLLDADIESIIELHKQGYGYRRLAVIFECSKGHIRRIVKHQQRAQRSVEWRKVSVPSDFAGLMP